MFNIKAVNNTNIEIVDCISAIVNPIPPIVVRFAMLSLVDVSIIRLLVNLVDMLFRCMGKVD